METSLHPSRAVMSIRWWRQKQCPKCCKYTPNRW